MLLDLADDVDRQRLAVASALDADRRIDLRQLLGLEFHVDDRPDNLNYPAYVVCHCFPFARFSNEGPGRRAVDPALVAHPFSASAPPVISVNSWVICV